MADAATLVDVWKTYETGGGRIEALSDVSAVFAPGAVTAVVGPSGSGKSTLLSLLAALDRPTNGDVVVAGAGLGGLPPRRLRLLRRDAVTFVFQRPADNFVPHLTLAEHARLAARGRERDRGGLFERFGIADRVDHEPRALSGGEQARAAFALALMRGTPLIVADEPTAELDGESALRLLEAIRSHAAVGVAFVVASHDPNVVALSDAVLRLDRGRVVPAGQPLGRTRDGESRATGGRPAAVVLAATGLRKSYRRGPEVVHAVDGVDIEFRQGELNALVGRSGSGKSTLLGLLAGWQNPDAGTIAFTLGGGVRHDPATLGWGELAFLPQKFGLMDELTVRENIEYPARLAGCLEARRPWIESLVTGLGLAELATRLPRETSIGQQQRTALARALVLAPSLLLADEPTSHQDAGWRDAVLRTLREAARTGVCCVVATHEESVAVYADARFELSEGRLVTWAATVG